MARMSLRFLVIAALLVSATACKKEAASPVAATATPNGAIQAAVATLKNNDLKQA